ncbi:30177_t:CDS:2 [Racocetra persica]|uniref:30177_t:CDS:1 n=1 Tax=Racocetra persica TaxID=160502 RepID=A0ACA9QJE9_9GLOM|nr:30177_t:CDS:2 [Racocetra persica]
MSFSSNELNRIQQIINELKKEKTILENKRTLKNKSEQLEKEKKINIEVHKTIEILNQKAESVLKNFNKTIAHPTLRNRLEEKNECKKTDLTNQQIINENKNLKKKDYENKIPEIRLKIKEVKKLLESFIKHNNLKKDKILINESLDNFKITYKETNSLEDKIDLIIEFSKTIKNNIS